MTKEVAKRDQITKLNHFQSVEEMKAWAMTVLDSGLLPASIKTPEEVITIVQHGKELGLSPHISLNNIHVIAGRPTLSSSMLGALVKKSGIEFTWPEDYEMLFDKEGNPSLLNPDDPNSSPNRRTTIEFQWISKVTGGVMKARHSVTFAQMTIAGYTTKENWQRFPKEMMRARCLAYGVRALFPEILSGSYTDMEIVDSHNLDNDISVSEEGEVTVKFNNQ